MFSRTQQLFRPPQRAIVKVATFRRPSRVAPPLAPPVARNTPVTASRYHHDMQLNPSIEEWIDKTFNNVNTRHSTSFPSENEEDDSAVFDLFCTLAQRHPVLRDASASLSQAEYLNRLEVLFAALSPFDREVLELMVDSSSSQQADGSSSTPPAALPKPPSRECHEAALDKIFAPFSSSSQKPKEVEKKSAKEKNSKPHLKTKKKKKSLKKSQPSPSPLLRYHPSDEQRFKILRRFAQNFAVPKEAEEEAELPAVATPSPRQLRAVIRAGDEQIAAEIVRRPIPAASA